MSSYTLPFLFINLGGEMLYILDQRLRAQKISGDKSKKVLNDIAGIMLNQQFLDELFKPQEVYSKAALRSLFHDLAHASIMRLNDSSMSKLYDLMMMVFKQQVFCATQPKDLILITLNHLDSMRYLVSSPAIHKQLDATYFLIVKTYGQMRSGELQRIRYHLLNFFQDMRIRVSIFLRNQVQNNDGTFVIPVNNTIAHGNEVPGNIRVYSNDGCIDDLINFPPGGVYTVAAEAGSTELRGIRHTALGTNIYSTKSEIMGNSWDQAMMDSVGDNWECKESSTSYREELNLLLIQLTGSKQTSNSSQDVICLNLFDSDENDSVEKCQTRKYEIVNIKSTPEHSATLVKIMSEMAPHTSSNEISQPNVLDLMDGLV